MVMKSSWSVEIRSFRSSRKYTDDGTHASTMDGNNIVWMLDQKSWVRGT